MGIDNSMLDKVFAEDGIIKSLKPTYSPRESQIEAAKKVNEALNEKKNIIIEGHTDSQMFRGLKSEDEQYAKNLELSSMRATEIANYVFKTNYDKKYSKKLRKVLITTGKSNTEPVLTNNKEDFDKSRRVELEVRMKAGENVLEKMLNQKGLL